MEQGTLRSDLKRRTRGLHARLDAALTGPQGRVADQADYVRVLTALHALHDRADAPLAGWARSSPLAEGLDAAVVPDRAPAYRADLASLGVPVPPARPEPPATVDDAAGLALLYVVAGSSIGARAVLHGLPDAVPLDARRGLTDAAGRASAALWRQARTVLSRPVDAALHEAVVAGARGVFEQLLDRAELVAS